MHSTNSLDYFIQCADLSSFNLLNFLTAQSKCIHGNFTVHYPIFWGKKTFHEPKTAQLPSKKRFVDDRSSWISLDNNWNDSNIRKSMPVWKVPGFTVKLIVVHKEAIETGFEFQQYLFLRISSLYRILKILQLNMIFWCSNLLWYIRHLVSNFPKWR